MSDETIVPQPSASKRRSVAPIIRPPRAMLDGIRSLLGPEDGGPVESEPPPSVGTGSEPPGPDDPGAPIHLDRVFAFVDVCGFTAYVDGHGTHAAIDVLTRFRSVTRDVAARRGVRVGKWLGDGVMLVGTETGPTVAAAAELVARFHGTGIDIHVGLAEGDVLLFEGDDYIGRPVNLASRLCDAASEGEMLALVDPDRLPAWVEVAGKVTVRVTGVGDVDGVGRLVVSPELLHSIDEDPAA